MALPLTVESFRAVEPNFVDTPDLVIQAEIDRATITTKSYETMPTPALQELALIYHVCHYLTLAAAGQAGMGGGAIKQIKSQNDTIVFAVADETGFKLAGTPCGQKLMDLISVYQVPVFIASCW